METATEDVGWFRLLGRVGSAILDPTIVLSFDRTGYLVHRMTFVAGDLEVDLDGKVCVVTGANSGLGFEAAKALARRRGRVWLLCRDRGRGTAAVERIRRQTKNDDVHLAVVDLSSQRSVRAAVDRFADTHVHVLVNNAGILPDTRTESADGIELTWATNVVGPFLLTHLLMPKLKAARGARVINVSSGGMYTQKLDLSDVQAERKAFDGVAQYALTKRAEVVLTELWAERLAGTKVTVNSMHPGWADTPGVRSSLPGFFKVMRRLLRSPAEGADTIVWLAVCPRIAGHSGRFWFDRQPRSTHYLPWTREDPADRERLWALCCAQAGIDTARHR